MEKVTVFVVRLNLILVVIAACVAMPATAQSPRDSVIGKALGAFRPGQPIQVALERSRWTGRFERASGDTLFIGSRGKPPMAFRFNAIDTLWRQHGHFSRGAWIGGTTFGVYGMLVVRGLGGDGSSTLGAGAALGLVGALTGGLIGTAFKRWVVVYP